MRLSQRIKDICSLVEKGETVSDIGTDHAYVPMYLIKNGISPYAIMSDISKDSLLKAIETFKIAKIDIKDKYFRVGDGLEKIDKFETDVVIIAGLGAYTIIDILEKDIDKSKTFKKLILQPRKFSGELRYYLTCNGWKIIKEKLSPEGKFICEIIVAIPENEANNEPILSKNDIKWSYPESLAYLDYDLLKKRVNWKLFSIDEEINNLSKSKTDNSSIISKLKKDREYLEALLERCKQNNKIG